MRVAVVPLIAALGSAPSVVVQPYVYAVTLFPGYTNSAASGGHLNVDTRTLTNGLHTIAWVVRDSAGNAKGSGSRYFTVENP